MVTVVEKYNREKKVNRTLANTKPPQEFVLDIVLLRLTRSKFQKCFPHSRKGTVFQGIQLPTSSLSILFCVIAKKI